MNNKTYSLPFQHLEHGVHNVAVNVCETICGNGKEYLLSCHLPVSREFISSQASDCFSALQSIRRKLEGLGWAIHCLGARKNVWPSGMSRDMGGGFKAYAMKIGQPTKELVDILESDDSPDGSTVKEQEEFFKSWVDSL